MPTGSESRTGRRVGNGGSSLSPTSEARERLRGLRGVGSSPKDSPAAGVASRAGSFSSYGGSAVYRSSAGRSAAAAGRNVFAGSTSSPSPARQSAATGTLQHRLPSSYPSSNSSGSPGSVKGRVPAVAVGSKSPAATRSPAPGLSNLGSPTAPLPSNSGNSHGHGRGSASPLSPSEVDEINRRRRRLTQSYGGESSDEGAQIGSPTTSREAAREISFSVVTAARGMDRERKTKVGQCRLAYGSSSHPGNDPAGFQKDNQDAWVVKENFGNTNGIFFGVFDGHGYDGRKVSHALVNRLPKILSASEKFKKGYMVEAATHACIDCNAAIKRVSSINTDLSGSTGIMAYLHGNGTTLTVINVGDSRCILGKADPGGTTEGIPLNTDHTPTVPEEAARIQQHEGRIGAFQHMGQPVGPLRVWLPDRDIPGLCMTRSFGDNVAASVGVYSKPEVQETFETPVIHAPQRKLADDDKYLVLCSDGITEFMTNDEIIAFVHKLARGGLGPLEIAGRMVKEARRRWSAEENDVIDDCTAIVIFLDREAAPR